MRMGFPEAGGRFDPQNGPICDFTFSAPFGASPFYGYPSFHGAEDTYQSPLGY